MSAYIDLKPYHKSIELLEKASLSYRTQCVRLKLNCESEYNQIVDSYKDLQTRLNNIYHILLERPVQRKKRFLGIVTGLIGIGFGIGNTIQAKNLAKDVENMRNYMKENFDDIKNLLEKQNAIQVELKNQQNALKGVLEVHETRINEIFTRIEKLEESTNNLQKQIDAIRMRVIFQNMRIDFLEILGKLRELEQWMLDLTKNILHPEIFSPQNITDSMHLHQITSGKFLAPPHLNNFEFIKETIVGSAFIIRDLKTIFINLKIPIYRENNLNLYEVMPMPIIKNKKILRLANVKENFCVLSADKEEYYCTIGNHKFIKGKNKYFVQDNTDISLLPTATATSKCIINILTQRSIDFCRFKVANYNFEIMQEIDTHKYLFAIRDKTPYTNECYKEDGTQDISENNFMDTDYLQGTGLLYLKPNCSFRTETEEHIFKTSGKSINIWHEKDIFNFEDIQEDIENKFKSTRFGKSYDGEITSVNFEDLTTMP